MFAVDHPSHRITSQHGKMLDSRVADQEASGQAAGNRDFQAELEGFITWDRYARQLLHSRLHCQRSSARTLAALAGDSTIVEPACDRVASEADHAATVTCYL